MGEVVPCCVTVYNKMGPGYSYDVYVNGTLIGTAEFPDDSYNAMEIPYDYIVKAADLERGYFENTAEIRTKYENIDIRPELFEIFSTVSVRADVAAPEGSGPHPDEQNAPVSEDKSKNPETGASSQFAAAAFAVVVLLLIQKKR